MITQAIKNWLHKMFAWWPWKKPSEIEFTHDAGPINKGAAPGSISRSTIDGVVPQAGAIPRLSTIEGWPERDDQPPFPAADELPPPPVEMAEDPVVVDTPPAEQRLKFLRYLVKRGIVNEGFEEEN